jgi:hypothetical protein
MKYYVSHVMRSIGLTLGAAALLSACGSDPGSSAEGPRTNASEIHINGRKADEAELARLERTYGVKVAPGNYWHDARSGLAGYEGAPPQAWAPGFDFGAVPRDASQGATGILYNGRELPMAEATFYASLFDISAASLSSVRGSYVLQANGDLYRADDGAYLGNLLEIARRKGYGRKGGSAGGGGDKFWSHNGAAGNSDGTCSYVSLPGGDTVTSGCG